MKYMFLAIFFISSIIHLYASYNKDVKLRAYSKGFILFGLLGFYLFAANPVLLIVVLAIIFSWLGDLLLIPKGTKWFVFGGISFMASHACFVIAYLQNIDFSRIPIWAIVLVAAFYFAAATLVFSGLKPHLPNKLFYPFYFYLLINGTMNCCAFLQLLSKPCLASAITFIGAMLFFASDSILFYVRFNKNCKIKSHFAVMLTYILAELLIVLGLIWI